MNAFVANWSLLAIPSLPLAAGAIAVRCDAVRARRLAVWSAAAALALLALCVTAVAALGPISARVPLAADGSSLALTLRLDAISAVMGALVAGIGLAIARFSAQFLKGEGDQAVFLGRLSMALGAALVLALAGNLYALWLAWVGSSLAVHRLLLHYPERVGAQRATRKKFVVSRLSDACLLAAIVVVLRQYGTIEFGELFAAAGDTTLNPAAGWLIAIAAVLKSAQFPFHSWLPDTMETPTPVSAFMHAGIVNGGGFLVVRLHPLMASQTGPLASLILFGCVTAAYGAIVMLAQPSVKRALAYSTIAQMGFMMLQCGFGAFGLALLHIVAHALYKAHSFLRSGSAVGAASKAAAPLSGRSIAWGIVAGIFACAFAFVVQDRVGGHLLSLGAMALAVAFSVARAAAGLDAKRGLAFAVTVAVAGFAAVVGLDHLAGAVAPLSPETEIPWAIQAVAWATFAGLFALQLFLGQSRRYRWGRALYVHALNGLYVGTLANRLIDRHWPVPASVRESGKSL